VRAEQARPLEGSMTLEQPVSQTSNVRQTLVPFAVAVLATLAFEQCRLWLVDVLGTAATFLFAYPAVVVAAWYGGLLPGLASTALSVLLVSGVLVGNELGLSEVTRVAVFSLSGLLISALSEQLRRTSARAGAAEQSLVSRERMLAESQRLSHTGSWEIELSAAGDGKALGVRCSDEACRIFGRDPRDTQSLDVEAARVLFYDTIHPDDCDRVSSAVQSAIAMGQSYELEHRILRPDGQERHLRQWAEVLLDEEGRPRRVLGTCQDITEQKIAEEELRRARAEAEASSRAKDQFLAVLSHELRTPLTPVLTAAQILESRPPHPDKVRQLGAMMRRNVELEARIIDDLLDLTRVSRGKLALHLEPVLVHEVIGQVARACTGELDDKKLRLETELRADSCLAWADQARLQQVLWNLVKNAVKFSRDSGRIVVRTANCRIGFLTIEVMDEGIGIDGALLPKIFEAFEQGGRETTRRFGGLGLGLAVTKAIVEAQGGSIEVRSDGVDRGTTFAVHVPLADDRARAAVELASPGERATSARVLLVEDNEDTLEVMTEILCASGYSVKPARSVADAIRVASAEPFDVLVSDVGLPDGTGLDLMRHLQMRRLVRGVAVSGFGMEADVRDAKAAGFMEHLTKPVNPQRLLTVLATVLQAPLEARAGDGTGPL
jgi:PAS domain S-box-containing protein